jgi:serine/threonine protein kinase
VRSTTRKNLTAATVADRYTLEREMARGGMGTVWCARDTKLGRQVAVKVMAQELAQMGEALTRFEREALAVAQLRSAHVVEVYDYGVQEGLPYIVMELLVGDNLGQRLKRLGRIPLEDTVRIMQQICKGLKVAHSSGLIHRDIKPSNIFLARRDDDEVVKLLDFGVVKALDPLDGMAQSEATATGILLGTPQYMSPEQARAIRDIDHRSDLWSVAVIAFRMLSGHNPFKGESVGDVVLKICSDTLPRIQDHNPNISPVLDAFFERAFQRAPSARYQSAVEMSAAFTALARGEQPAAAAPIVPRVGATTQVMPSSQTVDNNPDMRASFPSVPGDDGAVRPSMSSIPGVQAVNVGLPVVSAPYEATPISTTVGGTQLVSKFPEVARSFGNLPAALVLGAAATLVVGTLVAVVWVGGSGSDGTAQAGQPMVERMVLPIIEVPDDEDDEDVPAPADDAVEVDVDDGAGKAARSGSLDEADRPTGPMPKTADKPPTTRKAPAAGSPAPKSGKSKSGDSKPDWGL